MLSVNDEFFPVKCLELKGLTDRDFFKYLGLLDENTWSRLMAAYEGHPAYLKDIASLISHVFGGKVSEFLAEDCLVIPSDTQLRLKDILKRLSPIEKKIIFKASECHLPISREELRQDLDLSLMELINGLQSLARRYLIKMIEGDTVLFDLSGVIREYLRITGKNDQ